MEYQGYKVTDEGKIYNKAGHELKFGDNGEGYKYVIIGDNKMYVHRLVAMLYLKNYDEEL